MNKMKNIALITLFIISVVFNSNAQEWKWSTHLTSASNVRVNDIDYDKSNDAIILLGVFQGTLTLGSNSYTSFGNKDIILIKYDNLGNLLWAKQLGSTGKDVPKDVFVDNAGNIYATGSFSDNANFDGITLFSYNEEDIFLCKFNSSGTILWAKNIGAGPGLQRSTDLSLSPDDNLLISGFYDDSLFFSSDTIVSNGVTNNFIAKFNTSGEFINTIFDLKGSNGSSRIMDISVSPDKSILVSGHFLDTLFFPEDTLVSLGSYDIFLLSYNKNLENENWIRHAGSVGDDRLKKSNADIYGNIYAIGYFENNCKIDSSGLDLFDGTPIASNGSTDILIIKYNASGILQWRINLGDVGKDGGFGINIDQNLLHIAGNFSGTVIFNNDTIQSSSTSDQDVFFGVLNTNNNPIMASSVQGDAFDQCQAIEYDGKGDEYIAGYFASSSLTIGSDVLANGGGTDGFLAKYSIPFKITITSQQNVSCNGGSDGSATVTPYFGTYPYTYNWSYDDGTADSTLTGVPAGDYWVTVTDANSKKDSVAFTITEPAPIYANAAVTDVSCVNGNNGAIDITVTGGTSPYTYLWTTSNGSGVDQTAEDQSGLTAGDYDLTITDDNGCTKDTTIIVSEPDPITFGGSTVTAIERPPGENGAVDLNVHGGTPAYSYSWEGPEGYSDTEEDIDSLDVGGTYKVTVTDSHGCTGDTSFLVEDKTALIAIIDSIKDVTCYSGNDGYAHVTVTGGSGNYDYQWTNSVGTPIGANSPSLKDVPAGTYYVEVTDQLDARTANTSATISQPDHELTIAITAVENVTCNGLDNGRIDITVTGGWLPYTYAWSGSNGFTANTEDIANLAPGYYSVTVIDSAGCQKQQTNIQITEPPALTVTIQTNKQILCNGELTGELEAMPAGGTPAYTYLWDDPGHQTTKKATYLEAGTYQVTVTDANGCTANATETLSQPDPITFSATVQDVSCAGGSDGAVILTVSGGTPSYGYLWTPGNATTKDLTGATAGDYTVNITDANNCMADSTFTISEPPALAVTGSVTDVSCNGGFDGAVDITVTGGTPPYTYSWSNGPTTEDIGSLPAGDYTVIISDAHNCSLTQTYTVNEPPAITVTSSITNVGCNGDNDGAIDITVSGGTPGYTFSWSNGATTEDISNLTAGNYSVTITDALNCTHTENFTVTEPDVLAVSGDVTDVTIAGNSDGAIDITVSGGTAPYSYAWTTSDGSGLVPTDEDQTGLTAGTYQVTVTDAHHCSVDATFAVSEPGSLTITGTATDVTCNGGTDGAVDITVGGGVPPYGYSWSNGATSEDLTGVAAGTYTVTVTDKNGATIGSSYTVGEPTAITITSTVTDAQCNGSDDGGVSITVTGGTPPYTYSWSNGAITKDISGVTAGTYAVTVTDDAGCMQNAAFTVGEPAIISIVPAITNVSCNGSNDGIIDITVGGGTPPYSFSWSNGATTEDITGLTAGSYTVTVTDAHGCTQTGTYAVNEPAALDISGNVTDVTIAGNNDGAIDITVTGGTEPYSYAWSTSDGSGLVPTDEDQTGLTAGTYQVTVTDDNGCTLDATYTVTEPAALTLDGTVTDVTCNGDMDGAIDITVTGGVEPYTFSWSNGESSEDLTGLSGGTYTVTVADANGASIEGTYIVNEPAALMITAVDVTDITGCPGSANGALAIHASGGMPPLEFSIDGGSTWLTDSVFTGLETGDYEVSVLDAHGCSVMGNSYTLTDPPGVNITEVPVTEITCPGSADGSLVILVAGGAGPYSYSIDGGTTFWPDSLFSDLPPGNYDIAVKDGGSGCIVNGNTIMLADPDPISINEPAIDPTCPGFREGAIMVTATGGTGTLSFLLLNDEGAPVDSSKDAGNFENLDIGTYTIRVDDENRCGPVSRTAEIPQAENCELVIYNAFSPNGDGKNEEWHIRGIQAYPNCVVKVFNTWGNQVFSSKGYTQPWDGTYNGKTLPAGTYYYIIELEPGGKTYSGSVNIVK